MMVPAVRELMFKSRENASVSGTEPGGFVPIIFSYEPAGPFWDIAEPLVKFDLLKPPRALIKVEMPEVRVVGLQPAFGLFVDQMAEVPPVDLELLGRLRFNAQIGLGKGSPAAQLAQIISD